MSFWSCFSSVLVVAQTTKTKQQQWKKHLIIGWPHNSAKNTIKQRVLMFFVVGVSLVGVPLTRQNDKTTRQQTTTTTTNDHNNNNNNKYRKRRKMKERERENSENKTLENTLFYSICCFIFLGVFWGNNNNNKHYNNQNKNKNQAEQTINTKTNDNTKPTNKKNKQN